MYLQHIPSSTCHKNHPLNPVLSARVWGECDGEGEERMSCQGNMKPNQLIKQSDISHEGRKVQCVNAILQHNEFGVQLCVNVLIMLPTGFSSVSLRQTAVSFNCHWTCCKKRHQFMGPSEAFDYFLRPTSGPTEAPIYQTS